MYTAKDAAALRTRLKAEGASRAEIIQALSASCLGWPYVSPGTNDSRGIDCSGLFVKRSAGLAPF